MLITWALFSGLKVFDWMVCESNQTHEYVFSKLQKKYNKIIAITSELFITWKEQQTVI